MTSVAPESGVGWRPVAIVSNSAAAAALLVSLAAAGGAPRAAPAGIPDPGALTRWGLPVLVLLEVLAAVAVVGHLLLLGMLSSTRAPKLRKDAARLLPTVGVLAAMWWALALLRSLFEVSDRVAEPLPGALRGGTLTGYALESPDGRAALAVLVLTLPIALFATTVSSVRGTRTLLFLAIAALVPPAFAGHATSSGNPRLAAFTLAVHIIGVSVWVGGLAVLLVRLRELESDPALLHRFSGVALACFLAVGTTGVANALLHVPFDDLVRSSYGALAGVKLLAFLLLGALGVLHRRRALPHLVGGGHGRFLRLAVMEVTLMALTLGVAVGLSRTPPPI